jgi:hypothetical protein
MILRMFLDALPPFAQDEIRRRAGPDALPATPAELFDAIRSWLTSAGIAEGRGGYPGGRGKPDWTTYVAEQQRSIAVFRAAVEAYGDAPGDGMTALLDYERAFPPAIRMMGDGYEPHVDDVAGRLVYSLPVDSGIVSLAFSFPVRESDLRLMLSDPYRRAVLEVVAHTVLQRSMIRGNPEVTELDFRRLVDQVLYAPADDLAAFIATIDRKHNMSTGHFVRAALARRETASPP